MINVLGVVKIGIMQSIVIQQLILMDMNYMMKLKIIGCANIVIKNLMISQNVKNMKIIVKDKNIVQNLK